MVTVQLTKERALGEGTRPKDFILGQVDSVEAPNKIKPAKGVTEREILTALRNGLCRQFSPPTKSDEVNDG